MDENSQVRTQFGDSEAQSGEWILIVLPWVMFGIGVGIVVYHLVDRIKKINTPWGGVEFKD